jgi:hypothetical protein
MPSSPHGGFSRGNKRARPKGPSATEAAQSGRVRLGGQLSFKRDGVCQVLDAPRDAPASALSQCLSASEISTSALATSSSRLLALRR